MKPVSQDPHAAHVVFRNQINGCFDGIDPKGTKSPQLLAEMLKKVLERCGFAFEMTVQGNRTAGVRLFPLRKSTTTYRTSPEGLLCHALAPQSKVDGHNSFTAQSFPRRGTLRLFAAEADLTAFGVHELGQQHAELHRRRHSEPDALRSHLLVERLQVRPGTRIPSRMPKATPG